LERCFTSYGETEVSNQCHPNDRLTASHYLHEPTAGLSISSTVERHFHRCTSYDNAGTMQLKSLNYTLLSQSEAESPDEFRSRRGSNLFRRSLIWGLVGLLGFGILIGVVVGLTRSKDDYDLGNAPACPQYSPTKPRSETRARFEQDLVADLSSDEFLDASVKRLQGAVKIPTESYDDMKLVGDDPRWDVFVDFHNYLEKTFPLVSAPLR